MSFESMLTKEKQIEFLNETITKIESIKQSLINDEVIVTDASVSNQSNAETERERCYRNIYINIDYEEANKQNIDEKRWKFLKQNNPSFF